MRPEQLTVSKQNNVEIIKYSLALDEVYDENIIGLLPNNVIPFRYNDGGDNRRIIVYVHETINLGTYIKAKREKREVLALVKGLVECFEIMKSGIPTSYILKDFGHFYIEPETMKVSCVVIPVLQNPANILEIADFFRRAVSGMNFNENDRDNHVARLLNVINGDGFSLEALKGLCEELLKGAAAPVKEEEVVHGTMLGHMMSRPVPYLIRKKTGEKIVLSKSEFTIGKSKTMSDYAIEGNTAISRQHCTIIQKEGRNYIKDNNSTNHTYVGDICLREDEELLLKNHAIIRLSDEEFTFFLRKED